MHLKRNCLFIPLLSASLLTGCAAQATDRTYAPVPQALIEAAEQASQMRMVYADWQARAHGHTVESIRLDSRDADAPDFMRAQVRLDYNGPMQNVLTRVANDIGYRLNEYSKPAAGLSWTPWMRLSGNKALLDHVREMNSQVPWHIVLDHQNRRLVIDYSDDGSMAAQIRSARQSLETNSGSGQVSMPATPDMYRSASQVAVAETLSNKPAMPRTANTPPPVPAAPSEVWYAAIEGYDSNESARSMVVWLAQLGLSAHVYEVEEGRFDVRVLAENSRDAIQIRDLMDSHGVPSQLGFEEIDDNAEIRRRAEQAMRDGWPIDALTVANETVPYQAAEPASETQAPSSRQPASSFGSSQSDLRELATSRIVSGADSAAVAGQWSVQLSYSNSLVGLGRAIRSVESKGFNTGLISVSGSNYMLRAIGLESRGDANSALAQLRSLGFSDAYLVSPKGE